MLREGRGSSAAQLREGRGWSAARLRAGRRRTVRGAWTGRARSGSRPRARVESPSWHGPRAFTSVPSCGHEEPRWHGRCPGCGEWNTLVEEPRGRSAPARQAGAGAAQADPAAATSARRRCRASRPGSASSTACSAAASCRARSCCSAALPGIGKSTLTNMVLGNLAGAGRRTLYVSGEESTAQVALRAARLPGARPGGAGDRRNRPRDGGRDRSSASSPTSA